MLQQLTETHRHAPTVSRFVDEHFTDLVPDTDDEDTIVHRPRLTMHLYRRLVRYDDTEATPTASTKPEEVLLRLPSEFTRADAVRVGGEFGVAVSSIDCSLVI